MYDYAELSGRQAENADKIEKNALLKVVEETV